MAAQILHPQQSRRLEAAGLDGQSALDLATQGNRERRVSKGSTGEQQSLDNADKYPTAHMQP